MKISKEEVRHVVRLARLQIDDATVEKMAAQIGQVLAYIDTLNEVDTTDVAPTSHAIELTNAFREDVLGTHLERKLALANAPGESEGAFTVPRVLD